MPTRSKSAVSDQHGLREWLGRARPVPLLFAVVLALFLSRLALQRSAHPFGWIALCWVGCFSSWALISRNVALRVLGLNAAILTLGAGISETILLHREKLAADTRHYDGAPPVKNDWLGSAFRPSSVIHAWHREGDRLLFDVRYTNDSFGLRIGPPLSVERPKGTVLFFGCSYAYGEGLNDEATLPYQVGVASGGSYRILNFAGGGYGPHQMLSSLEHGLVDRVVGGDSVRYAVYEAIPEHVLRAVGRVPFQRHAPRYRIANDGKLVFAGHFDDRSPNRLKRVGQEFERSALYRFMAYQVPRLWPVPDSDLRTYLAIVSRSRDILRTKYPNIRFEVLLWGDGRDLEQRIATGLDRLGIPVQRVPEILPHFDEYLHGSRYRVSPDDIHPDSIANAILARYLASRVPD